MNNLYLEQIVSKNMSTSLKQNENERNISRTCICTSLLQFSCVSEQDLSAHNSSRALLRYRMKEIPLHSTDDLSFHSPPSGYLQSLRSHNVISKWMKSKLRPSEADQTRKGACLHTCSCFENPDTSDKKPATFIVPRASFKYFQ